MDIVAELVRLLGLKSQSELTLDTEVFGQGGFLSFRRPVTVARTGQPPLHLFVKSSDVTRTELDLQQPLSNQVCRTECVFYGLMAPVLERVMDQHGIEPMFPRTFGQMISDKGTVLVMEDMTKQGFSLISGRSVSIEQAYCVVRALARLQAAFWIARSSFNYSLDSVLFGRGSPFCDSLRKSGVDFRPMIERSSKYFFEHLSRHAKSSEDESLLRERVSKFIQTLVDDPMKGMPTLTDEPLGLSHADLWFANFMFKGEGDALTCRLFDWQFWDVGLFGFDLGLLMVTSLSSEAMLEHVDRIPAEFYDTFKDTFEAKTGDPAPFSKEAALGNMGYSLFFAMFWVIGTCGLLWESGTVDVPRMLENVAYIIRTKRMKFPFENDGQ